MTTALVPGTVGLAVQANGTSAASRGGDVIVQAGGASPNGQIDFTVDSVQAIGASSGGAPEGGYITVQSFNDGILGAAAGELNAAGGGPVGTVMLTTCIGDPARTYAGTVTGTETDAGPGTCGGAPSFPAVAHFVTGLSVIDFFANRQNLWDVCLIQQPLLAVSVAKSFTLSTINVGDSSLLTITLNNPNPEDVLGAAFTDTYPANVLNTAAPAGATTCVGGTVTALANGPSVALSGGTVPAGGSCTVTVQVTSNVPGVYVNHTGLVTTTNAGTAPEATATLTVNDIVVLLPNQPIPALSGWLLGLMSGLLALFALAVLRRSQR